MEARDGGVFAFGDAGFHGSASGLVTGGPAVDLRPTPDGFGYWLAASDGGVFAFGNAPFFGSAATLALARPVVGMAESDSATVNPQDYTMSGDAPSALTPGASIAIDLRISNPNPVPIILVATTTTVSTNSRACSPANFLVTQGPSTPVTVPAGQAMTLEELGVSSSHWPTVTMVDTGTNQDACQRAQLTLTYRGRAVG